MTTKDQTPFLEVFSGTQWEAELVKGLLEANDIPSMLKDESLSAVTAAYQQIGGEILVLVDDADFEAAKKIIAERDQE